MLENEMDFENRIIAPEYASMEDAEVETSLRPRTLGEYIGQEKAKENLSIFMQSAKLRGEALDHVLLYGPPGLGKTTLAGIVANEMGVNLRVTSGPAIEKPGDLAALLTNLSQGDILFIDEIHRLSRAVEEILYPAMEDYALDIIIGKGPSARSIRIDLPKFTLIGATTRAGQMTSPLRDRFGMLLRLELYKPEELCQIITRSAKILGVECEDAGAMELARRSRGTPRIANRLLKRVRDYALVLGDGRITGELADAALDRMEIDKLGLDSNDIRILKTIIRNYGGGPVGVQIPEGQLLGQDLEEGDVLIGHDGLVDAAVGKGAGGHVLPFPFFHQNVHAVAAAQAEELALHVVIILKPLIAAGGVQNPIADVDQIQQSAKLLFRQLNLHGHGLLSQRGIFYGHSIIYPAAAFFHC